MNSADVEQLQSGNFDDVLSVVEKIYGEGGVVPGSLMLVGARCRDLLNYRFGLRSPGRATQDTDIAVAVSSWEEFDHLYKDENLWVFDDEELLESQWFRAAALMVEEIRGASVDIFLDRLVRSNGH